MQIIKYLATMAGIEEEGNCVCPSCATEEKLFYTSEGFVRDVDDNLKVEKGYDKSSFMNEGISTCI